VEEVEVVAVAVAVEEAEEEEEEAQLEAAAGVEARPAGAEAGATQGESIRRSRAWPASNSVWRPARAQPSRRQARRRPRG
jgi:hypothetical protein